MAAIISISFGIYERKGKVVVNFLGKRVIPFRGDA
ncbi:unnamed protein product, partial [marine sediment metagenome]